MLTTGTAVELAERIIDDVTLILRKQLEYVP